MSKILQNHYVLAVHDLRGSAAFFEQLGFKAGLGNEPLPNLTWAALSKIPKVVGFGCVGLSAIYWITHRRQEVAAAERGDKETDNAAH